MYLQFIATAFYLMLALLSGGCAPIEPPASPEVDRGHAAQCLAASQPGHERPRASTTQPVRGLELTLETNVSSIHAGEEIEFTERLKNVSGGVIWENFRGFIRDVGPGIVSDDEVPGLHTWVMTTKHYATKLEPDEERTIRYKFTIITPGQYRFSCQWDSSYAANHQTELWQGKLSSNWVEMTVLEPRHFGR